MSLRYVFCDFNMRHCRLALVLFMFFAPTTDASWLRGLQKLSREETIERIQESNHRDPPRERNVDDGAGDTDTGSRADTVDSPNDKIDQISGSTTMIGRPQAHSYTDEMGQTSSLQHLLLQHGLITTEELVDETTPQCQAFDFISSSILGSVTTTYDDVVLMELYTLYVLFYATTQSAGWTNPWPLSKDKTNFCKGWYGIECTDAGRVQMLNLAKNNLVGTLPKELRALKHLKFIMLQDNPGLNGIIPKKVCDRAETISIDCPNIECECCKECFAAKENEETLKVEDESEPGGAPQEVTVPARRKHSRGIDSLQAMSLFEEGPEGPEAVVGAKPTGKASLIHHGSPLVAEGGGR